MSSSQDQGGGVVGKLGEGGRPLVEPRGLFIDGGWREAVAGGRRDVIDPSTGQVVTTVAEGAAADVDAAVAAARRAFDEGPWGRTTPRERARVLSGSAERLRERADELVRLESLDCGKPVTLCRMVDVNTVIEIYEYYAGMAQGLEGSTRQTPLPAMAYTLREPIGVVGAITPVQLPADPLEHQDRPGAGRRQHDRPQARRGDTRSRPSGWPSCWPTRACPRVC